LKCGFSALHNLIKLACPILKDQVQSRNIEPLIRSSLRPFHPPPPPPPPPPAAPCTPPEVIHINQSSSGISYDPSPVAPPNTQPPHPSISNLPADNASAQSTRTHTFSSSNKELKIPSFSVIDYLTECRQWYDLVLALLAAKSYYNPLLLSSGGINFAATDTSCNASLYAMLHPKLDKHIRTACQNSQCKTGNAILRDIFISFSDTVTNNTRGSVAYAAIHSLSWDHNKMSLNTFNSTFNSHLSCIHEANMDFSLHALKMCWIHALPDPFISVQAKVTQASKLPDKWESATSVNMLYQATKHWVTIYNINITPPKKLPPPNPRDNDTNPRDRDSDRAGCGGCGGRSTSERPTSAWSDRPPSIAEE